MEFLILLLFGTIVPGKAIIMLGENKKYKIFRYIKYLIPLAFLIIAIIEYNNYFVEIKGECGGFECLGVGLVPIFLVWFCIGQFIFTLGACVLTSIKKNDTKDEKGNDKFTIIHIVLVNILIYIFVTGFIFTIF